MRLPFIVLILLLIPASFVIAQTYEESDNTPSCPDGFPDRPALKQHLEQGAIITGIYKFDDLFDHGEQLFIARFNRCDGQGRPTTTGTGAHRESGQPAMSRISAPDSNSCAGCHNQPRPGGAGDFVANVFVLAQGADPVLTSTEAEFSNNRNTLGMFGAGPIEMLAREMTAELHAVRDAAIEQASETNQTVIVPLIVKGISFGSLSVAPDGTLDTSAVEGVDPDLIIKPFHQAGVAVSLREFTVNAMNHHHGMQAEERFDLNPDKMNPDYDQDGVERELTIGDITASVIWQAALGTPLQVLPEDRTLLASAQRGEAIFSEIGCASCHVPSLPLKSRFFIEPNPYNPPGTWSDTSQSFIFDMTEAGEYPRLEQDGNGAIVRAYTDLKRHNLCDPEDMQDAIRYYCNEKLAQNRPDEHGLPGSEFFLTRKLWDVGSSAPYGHRGDLTTIAEAILMHGGEARVTRDNFTQLEFNDQQALVDFLYTLQVVPAVEPDTNSTQANVPALSGMLLFGLVGGVTVFRRKFS